MNCKLLIEEGKKRIILKHTFYSTDSHLGEGERKGEKGMASFYQEFLL